MHKTLTLVSSLLLASSALAWTPALDAAAADQVIDSAVGRTAALDTVLSLDLGVKNGDFATPGAVALFRGAETCLSNWKTAPGNYAQNGSRPVSLLIGGQADIVFLGARDAWNNFDTPDPAKLLEDAKKTLPDGHLRVYMTLRGLPSERARDAYTVAARLADGTLLRPYRTNFLNDWKQAEDKLFSGGMVYYFDFSQKAPGPKLDLVVRTEARNDCVYLISGDLSKFK